MDEEAGTGSSRSYFTVLQQTHELPLQPIITGRYHDTFRRIEGVWCFEGRRMLVDQVGDLSQHLPPHLVPTSGTSRTESRMAT